MSIAPPGPSAVPFKVASYNMRKGIGLDRRRDPMRTLSVLNELEADIIALQEADRRFGTRGSAIPPFLFAEHSDYVPVTVDSLPHSIGWHGNALLLKKGSVVEACHSLHLPTVEPRGAVVATVAVAGQRMHIVGMHLDISGLRRRQQARAVLDYLARQEDLPAIMMGDCNEWRERGGALREFGAHHDCAATGPSFHTRRPVARLDRIFVSPSLSVLASGVHHSPLAARASDHLPIWATLASRTA